MKILKSAIVLLVMGGLTGSAIARITTFSPKPLVLTANKYYMWGIDFTLSQGEVISDATLMYYNVDDGKKENNDYLNTRLLDNRTAGVKVRMDNSGQRDSFAGMGPQAGIWPNDQSRKSRNFNRIHDFSNVGPFSDVNTNASTPYRKGRSNFGIGIDPDSRYTYGDNEVVINPGSITDSTTPVASIVPAPGAILLGGIGTFFVGWLRRRNSL